MNGADQIDAIRDAFGCFGRAVREWSGKQRLKWGSLIEAPVCEW